MADFFLDEGRLSPSDAAVALIVVGDQHHYLMQLRDQKPGIFYPGHWGLFGGATDPGETQERALLRELKEELNLDLEEIRYFTEFVFDFGFAGFGKFKRSFYEIKIERHAIDNLRLSEGAAMKVFPVRELLTQPRIVPFDAFAIWLHAAGHTAMHPGA